MLKTSWRDACAELLKDRPYYVSYPMIEMDTGIKASWLSSFAQGKIPDPSVNTIETLTAYLKKINKVR